METADVTPVDLCVRIEASLLVVAVGVKEVRSVFSGALERRFLRVDQFRRAEASAAESAPSQAPPLKSRGAKD